jgi:hypothetical protein
MSQRMKATTTLSAVLVVMIMTASVILTLSRDRDAEFETEVAWSVPRSSVQSLQVIDLDGDGTNELFVQDRSSYTVYGADGQAKWSENPALPLTTTMGDVDADGREDLVSFVVGGDVRATSAGEELWTTSLAAEVTVPVGAPSRAAVIRFASGPQVVVGDDQGFLFGLRGTDGAVLWTASLSGRAETRGLDDALTADGRHLVAADRAGQLIAFSDAGEPVWSVREGPLRRMRTFDLDGDGASETYFGGESGQLFVVLEGGRQSWVGSVGQQVVEVRDGELNGDPTSREVVVGGRSGGVVAFDAGGERRWVASVGDRVSDIVTIDLDDDGIDEALIGDEGGGLTVFSGVNGTRYPVASLGGGVAALDEGRLSEADQIVVAAGASVSVMRLTRHDAPFFYTPLLAGLLLSLGIVGAGLLVGGLPERTPERIVVTDSSPAGLLARRRMLSENIADVEELQAQGEIDGRTALAKLEELRAQLAETDQGLREAGVAPKAEAMKCPNCGGRVRLGRDRCEYCGEVVIF